MNQIDTLSVNAIRILSADAIQKANSGHPGLPEYGHTVGVEATTGPLGAGMGMAVGMAMAEAHLESVFNKENYPVVDHYTYVLGGDGCMMEGISSEAFSLAGTLGLSKLIVLYDSNRISIEGSTDIAFRENDKFTKSKCSCKGECLRGNSLHHAAVAAEYICEVIDNRVAFLVEYGCQMLLSHCHTNSHAHTCA